MKYIPVILLATMIAGSASGQALSTPGGSVGNNGTADQVIVNGYLKLVNPNGRALTIERDDEDSWLTFHDPDNYWYSMGIDRSNSGMLTINSGDILGQSSGIVMNVLGNLGIGTSNLDGKLSIEGEGAWQMRLKDSNGGSDWRIGSSGTGWVAGAGKFLISNGASSGDASLAIDSQKKIGFGTAFPRAFLDVGSFISNGTLGSVFGRLPEGDGFGEGTYLGVRGYASQTDEYGGKSFSLEHAFYGNINSSINFYRGGAVTGGYLTFNTNNNIEQMRITGNGNVAIGTTNADAKLTVNGDIHTREVKVDLTGAIAPDYVFAKNYNLLSLSKLERYIDENSHLPETPSAADMEAGGLNLKEMNLLLLKKVEELTLYLIDEHKENALLRERVKELEDTMRVMRGKR